MTASSAVPLSTEGHASDGELPLRSIIRLASEEQAQAVFESYSTPTGSGYMTKQDYVDRCAYMYKNCPHLKENLLLLVQVPAGLPDNPLTMQCVGMMFKRRCIVKLSGPDSQLQEIKGFYVGGIFCPEDLRGQGIALGMLHKMLGMASPIGHDNRLLSFAQDLDTPIYRRGESEFCSFAFGTSSLYGHVSRKGADGLVFMQLPFRADGSLDLPNTLDDVDCQDVRLLSLEDASDVLEKNETLMRKHFDGSSQRDRFAMVPELSLYKSWLLASQWHCTRYNYPPLEVMGVEIGERGTDTWSFLLVTYSFVVGEILPSTQKVSSADHMAKMLKKVSESRAFRCPQMDKFRLTSIPLAYAQQFGLPYEEGYCGGESPLIRLPETLSSSARQVESDIHWLCLDQNTEPLRW